MKWSILKFGKHKGKSLPQVLFSDPDWFFWSIEQKAFKYEDEQLIKEVIDINKKARRIKIPVTEGNDLVAEYIIHPPTGKFGELRPVGRDIQRHSGSNRKDYIDMSAPRTIAPYDKLGYKTMLKSMKFYLFGSTKHKMTKERCEIFFSDENNFVL